MSVPQTTMKHTETPVTALLQSCENNIKKYFENEPSYIFHLQCSFQIIVKTKNSTKSSDFEAWVFCRNLLTCVHFRAATVSSIPSANAGPPRGSWGGMWKHNPRSNSRWTALPSAAQLIVCCASPRAQDARDWKPNLRTEAAACGILPLLRDPVCDHTRLCVGLKVWGELLWWHIFNQIKALEKPHRGYDPFKDTTRTTFYQDTFYLFRSLINRKQLFLFKVMSKTHLGVVLPEGLCLGAFTNSLFRFCGKEINSF